MHEVRASGSSDVGSNRRNNQDSLLVAEDVGLFLVSDGMGGHAAGEVASRLCAETIESDVRAAAEWLGRLRSQSVLSRDDREGVLHLLEEATGNACRAVFDDSQANPEHQGMGCTLTALLLVADRGFVAHVGDSRLYLFRNGEANALTKDHRVLDELLRAGRVSPERARALKSIDGLSRAVGVQRSVQSDLLDFEVMAGDRYLLCSDGLHGVLALDELSAAVRSHEVTDLPGELIRQTLDRGAPDNVSVVVLAIGAPISEDRAEETAEDVEATLVPGRLRAPAQRFGSQMQLLDSVPIFQHLAYQERMAFMAAADERRYDAGEILMHEGEPGEHFFVLVTGECSVRKGEAEIAVVGPGAPLGDMGLVNRGSRTATVVALTACSALIVGRQAFFQFLRSDPIVATKVLWAFVQVLTDRLARTSSELQLVRAGLAMTAIEMPIFRAPSD